MRLFWSSQIMTKSYMARFCYESDFYANSNMVQSCLVSDSDSCRKGFWSWLELCF